MKTSLLCAIALFGIGSAVHAQPSVNWIYTDSLAAPWIVSSWSTNRDLQSSEQVASGSHAIKLIQKAHGGLQFIRGGGEHAVGLNPRDYSYLEFAVYSLTANLALGVHLENAAGSATADRAVENVSSGHWVTVLLPMNEINPTSAAIHKVIIRSRSDSEATYFIDAIRFR